MGFNGKLLTIFPFSSDIATPRYTDSLDLAHASVSDPQMYCVVNSNTHSAENFACDYSKVLLMRRVCRAAPTDDEVGL